MNPLEPAQGDVITRYQRGPYVVAVVLAVALLPLIVVGAGVTSKAAGMAYPDWPTSGGHLVNPPGWWQGEKTLWEHGHRLLGWAVGMLAIVSAAFCFRRGTTLRTLGLATLLAIVVQGVLGGMRVRAVSTPLAMVHGIWGQVCFCLACVVALLTTRGWLDSGPGVEARGVGFFQRGTVVATVCTFVQLVFGAMLRHFGHRDALIAHVLWAMVVILMLSWAAMWALEQYPHQALLAKLGRAMAVLVGLQMVLGGLAFLVTVMGGEWPATLRWAAPSAHVLVGAMLLACSLLMTLSSRRLLQPATDGVGAVAPTATTR
jgi:cytochrome c oxidase assembly protein subunit 15